LTQEILHPEPREKVGLDPAALSRSPAAPHGWIRCRVPLPIALSANRNPGHSQAVQCSAASPARLPSPSAAPLQAPGAQHSGARSCAGRPAACAYPLPAAAVARSSAPSTTEASGARGCPARGRSIASATPGARQPAARTTSQSPPRSLPPRYGARAACPALRSSHDGQFQRTEFLSTFREARSLDEVPQQEEGCT